MTANLGGEGTRPGLQAANRASGGTSSRVERPLEPPDATPVTFEQGLNGVWLRWSVVEVDARAVPGAQGARCLIFTRQDCIRRVWDYPADWRALDDAGLAALSWQR